MKKLGEGLKALKATATLQEDQQCQLTWVPDTHVAEGGLVWPQWERLHLILQGLDALGLGDTGGALSQRQWERGGNIWNVNK